MANRSQVLIFLLLLLLVLFLTLMLQLVMWSLLVAACEW